MKSRARKMFCFFVRPINQCAVVLLWVASGAVAADREAIALATASITAGELKNHVDILADDTFEGREAGTRGGRAAGNYLLKEMERAGLRPAGEGGSFVQAVPGGGRNLLGLIPGGDEALRDEVIVIGAHYDHVGYGRATNSFGPLGYIHNGADDNASGVAGLLEILDAVRQLPRPPRRSLLVACWDAEEAGLIGSRHWVQHPTLPLRNVVAAINLDMIGRMRGWRLEVLGTRTATGLRRLVSEANGGGPLGLVFDWTMKSDSDHWSFYEREIPVLMFHTGLHEDYHRPSDDAHRINHAGLEAAARLAFRSVMQLAERDERPAFRTACRRENPAGRLWLEQPVAPHPPRFGMPLHVVAGPPVRVIAAAPLPGSPAERAGLKAQDELLEFQGRPIQDEGQLRLALLAAQGPCTLRVARPGVAEPLVLTITPQFEPIRVGISWRMDDAEPDTAIISQVIFGSAAQQAGVQVGDRVYELGGQRFGSEREFVNLLATARDPFPMLLERDGQLRLVTLRLLDAPVPAQ
jgi:hypothetical protein